MSKATVHETSESDGWSAFNVYVEQKPGVCDNCYKLTHETIKTYDPTELKRSLRGVLTDEVDRTEFAGDDYKQQRSTTTSHAYVSASGETKSTYCKNCGSDGKMQLSDPIPEEMLIDFGENVYERIEETNGLYLELSNLLNEITRLNDDPSKSQMSSRRIFQQSVDGLVKVNHEELPNHDSD